MKLNIDGIEYEYSVRYINNRAVAIGYRSFLRGANLRGANLTAADLRDANLYRANLRGVNLACADLAGADLSDAFGLSTVTGEPASLPEGWEYTEGKGIHKADAR